MRDGKGHGAGDGLLDNMSVCMSCCGNYPSLQQDIQTDILSCLLRDFLQEGINLERRAEVGGHGVIHHDELAYIILVSNDMVSCRCTGAIARGRTSKALRGMGIS